jgi:hypothetical protein
MKRAVACQRSQTALPTCADKSAAGGLHSGPGFQLPSGRPFVRPELVFSYYNLVF